MWQQRHVNGFHFRKKKIKVKCKTKSSFLTREVELVSWEWNQNHESMTFVRSLVARQISFGIINWKKQPISCFRSHVIIFERQGDTKGQNINNLQTRFMHSSYSITAMAGSCFESPPPFSFLKQAKLLASLFFFF